MFIWGFGHTYSYATMCVQCLERPEEGARSSRTGVKDVCKFSCRCWELNPVPLQDQQVLSKPSLYPPPISIFREESGRLWAGKATGVCGQRVEWPVLVVPWQIRVLTVMWTTEAQLMKFQRGQD